MSQTEFQRILSLPWREDYDVLQAEDEKLAELLTNQLGRPEGDMELWPIQGRALMEAMVADGLLAPIRVGGGKTLISLLLPTVLEARRPLILVPGPLTDQLERESVEYGKHFYIKPFKVYSYQKISRRKGWRILKEYAPDLIVADEVHKLKNKDSSRTKKIFRYFKQHPETKFAGLSGTITSKSIKDYNHLSFLSLKDNSPLPIEYYDLDVLSEVVDARSAPSKKAFEQTAMFSSLGTGDTLQKKIRTGYQRRFTGTPGVVSTVGAGVQNALYYEPVEFDLSSEIKSALQGVEDYWQDPEGTEMKYALDVHSTKRQVAAGFYYVWDWGPEGPDEEYLNARKEWHKLVSEKLKDDETEDENYSRAIEHYSRRPRSERGRQVLDQWLELVELAGFEDHHEAYHWFRDHQPEHEVFRAWREVVREHCEAKEVYLDSPKIVFDYYKHHRPNNPVFQKWCQVKDRDLPPTKPVWIDKSLVEEAAEFAASKDGPVIVWCYHQAVLDEFANYFEVYGAGDEMPESPAHDCAASITVQGTGKQLQSWSQNFVFQTPSSGQKWEQLVGRTHRPGQDADEVWVWANQTPPLDESLTKAKIDARYLQETTGQQQKFLNGTWISNA